MNNMVVNIHSEDHSEDHLEDHSEDHSEAEFSSQTDTSESESEYTTIDDDVDDDVEDDVEDDADDDDVDNYINASMYIQQPSHGKTRIIEETFRIVRGFNEWTSLQENKNCSKSDLQEMISKLQNVIQELENEKKHFCTFFDVSEEIGKVDSSSNSNSNTITKILPRKPLVDLCIFMKNVRIYLMELISEEIPSNETRSTVLTAVIPTLNEMITQLQDVLMSISDETSISTTSSASATISDDNDDSDSEPPKKHAKIITCEGCRIKHPSQKQHMGPGGCLNMDGV
jgi:hypothetical protein